jgi:putative transferase (TIGR04331 family)
LTYVPQKTLWVGNLPKHLDPEHDIVFSAAVLANREEILLKYSQMGLLAPAIGNTVDLLEAETLMHGFFVDYALPKVSSYLASDKAPTLSDTALSILVAPWAKFLLDTCWLNYCILQQHINTLGGERVTVVVPATPPFPSSPANSEALVYWLMRSEFHAWLVMEFLRINTPPEWKIVKYVAEEIGHPKRLKKTAYTSIFDRLREIAKQYLSGSRCNLEQLPIHWRLVFSMLLSILPVAPRTGPKLTAEPSRAGLLPNQFVDAMAAILNHCIPAYFRYGISSRIHANKRRGGYRNGFGRLATSNIFDDEANLTKALAYDAGEIIFSSQHGGGFGTHQIFPQSPESEYLGGPFITWGWERQGKYPIDAVPLPSPSLSGALASRKRTARTNDIVFVGGNMDLCLFRIHSKPIGEQWLAYRSQKIDFLRQLSIRVLGNVAYRGYYTGSLRDEQFILESFPALDLISGDRSTFWRRLVAARICVVDHPITTFHQAMAMNIPTIAYWDHDRWSICKQARPFFERLAAVGIVHRSGATAGEFLETNIDAIESWWASKGTQQARNLWCDRYARTSKHWLGDWIDALWVNQ